MNVLEMSVLLLPVPLAAAPLIAATRRRTWSWAVNNGRPVHALHPLVGRPRRADFLARYLRETVPEAAVMSYRRRQ
jgi:hypothetical protein